MAIDSGIYSQIQAPKENNLLAQYAQMQQIQGAQNQNRLADLMYGEKERDIGADKAMAGLLSQGGDVARGMAAQGYGKQSLAYTKQQQEALKQRGEIEKNQSEMLDKSLARYQSQIGQVNSPERAGIYTAAMYDDPVLSKFATQFGSRDEAIQRNMDSFTKDPRQWMIGSAGMTGEKLIATLKGTRQNTNLGDVSRGETTNYFGEVVPGQTTNTAIGQSADNMATNARSAANNAATVGATYAGQRQSATQHAATMSKPFEVTGQDGKPVLVQQDRQGNITPVQGYSAKAAKPMPGTAMKMQNDDLEAIGTFGGINADLTGIQKQITDGSLKFGPVSNLINQGRDYIGRSDEESRNLASFRTKMENMRNSVLLLNKGVQTEGDATRAMNEIFANINDQGVVTQRLKEIQALNQRAVEIRKNNIGVLRRNYGQDDMDFKNIENQPGATNLQSGSQPTPSAQPPSMPAGFKVIR